MGDIVSNKIVVEPTEAQIDQYGRRGIAIIPLKATFRGGWPNEDEELFRQFEGHIDLTKLLTTASPQYFWQKGRANSWRSNVRVIISSKECSLYKIPLVHPTLRAPYGGVFFAHGTSGDKVGLDFKVEGYAKHNQFRMILVPVYDSEKAKFVLQ